MENFETRGFDKTETRNNDSFRESVVRRGRAIIFVDTRANFAHEGRYRNENRGKRGEYRCACARARAFMVDRTDLILCESRFKVAKNWRFSFSLIGV